MSLGGGVNGRWAFLLALLVATTAPPSRACPADLRRPVESLAPSTLVPRPAISIPVEQIVQAEGGLAPEIVGRWGPLMHWPLTAIHAALLPNGKVLIYSYPDQLATGSAAIIWDPTSGESSPFTFERDVFCSGMSLLPDGRVYMTGGNDLGCPFQGTNDTHAYDPWTDSWERQGDLAVARWYPTNTPLADGRVLITSGLDRNCELTPLMEIYTPGVGLEVVPDGELPLDLYPRMHVLTNGWIARVGIEPGTWMFNPYEPEWRFVGRTVAPLRRWAGSSVQVPGSPDSILIFGGGSPATATVERIDFDEDQPAWRSVASMYYPRSHFNPVQLPDASVVIIGGGDAMLYDGPVLNAERYEPATDTWTLLPAQGHPRMYHSTALLLPDGRVLSAGQDRGASTLSAEIYEPAYLHRGRRPVILDTVPEQLDYGQVLRLAVDSDRPIASAALIAPGAVTHGVNMGQRYVPLEVTTAVGADAILSIPTSAHLAPLGYYLLFVVDDDGVPSIGHFVRLRYPTKG